MMVGQEFQERRGIGQILDLVNQYEEFLVFPYKTWQIQTFLAQVREELVHALIEDGCQATVFQVNVKRTFSSLLKLVLQVHQDGCFPNLAGAMHDNDVVCVCDLLSLALRFALSRGEVSRDISELL